MTCPSRESTNKSMSLCMLAHCHGWRGHLNMQVHCWSYCASQNICSVLPICRKAILALNPIYVHKKILKSIMCPQPIFWQKCVKILVGREGVTILFCSNRYVTPGGVLSPSMFFLFVFLSDRLNLIRGSTTAFIHFFLSSNESTCLLERNNWKVKFAFTIIISHCVEHNV